MASSLDLGLAGADRDDSNVTRVAMMSTTLMPVTMFAAVIAIALIRWSVVVPCLIFFFLGWSTVRQREWVKEATVHSNEGDERPSRPGIIGQVSEKMLQS